MKPLKKLRFTTWVLAMLFLSASGCQGGDSDPIDKNKDKTMPAYKVGDYFDHDGVKGIVAWPHDSNTGKFGWYLIVSLDETELAWSTEFVKTGSCYEGLGDWEDNDRIIKAIPGWETKYPAFKWCDDHNSGGITGWHMPQIGELFFLHQGYNAYYEIDGTLPVNKEAQAYFNKCISDIGGTPISDGLYWSSTEQNFLWDTSYWMVAKLYAPDKNYETILLPDTRMKSEVHKVRAVNYFHYNYHPDFD